MASTSSSAINLSSKQSTKIKPNTTSIPKESFKIIIDQAIDFGSLARNGIQVDRFFNRQQLEKFLQILHGPTYTDLVRQFWVKAEIYDEEASDRELAMKIKEDKSGKKKTRSDFGLP